MNRGRRRAARAALALAWPALLLAAGRPARAADPLPDTVARLRGSVLPVGTYSATDSPRFGFRGTGYVVGDGTLVATNAHVLPDLVDTASGPRMAVFVAGEPRAARVAATDRQHDLALLRLEGAPLVPLTLEEDGRAREGQAVALMGFPLGSALGFSPVTHRGIVSSITQLALQAPSSQQLDARAISRLRQGNVEVLQLDATAYPGNSGGPVFDAETGRVIGSVNMVLVKGTRESAISTPTGISYAIPVRYLRPLIAEAAQTPQTR